MRMRMASEKGDGEEEEDPNNGADSISMADGRRRGRREGGRERGATPSSARSANATKMVVFSRKNYIASCATTLGLFSHANAG